MLSVWTIPGLTRSLLLMVEILHDLMWTSYTKNTGIMVAYYIYMDVKSCRIYIITSITGIFLSLPATYQLPSLSTCLRGALREPQ